MSSDRSLLDFPFLKDIKTLLVKNTILCSQTVFSWVFFVNLSNENGTTYVSL